MNRQGHENVDFFIGPEVEYTPAHSKRTLFVVGKQSTEDILKQAREHRTTHIFMGANHSFNVDGDTYWDKTITELLDRGFWVTLDYPAYQHSEVLKMLNPGVWQSRIFVPLLSVRVPRVQTSSPNLTIKIDDIDFAATNDGVWCLHHSEATDSNRFTSWNEYSSDEVIGKVAVAEAPVTKKVVTVVEELKTSTVELDGPVVAAPDLNDNSIGLDTEVKEATVTDEPAPEVTATDAAEAYAGTATEPAKTKKAKKAE